MKKYLAISTILIVFLILMSGMYAFAEEGDVPLEVIEVEPFFDISEGDYGYVAIKYLHDEGIINGYPDGTFKPDNSINRIEALKVILEATGQIDEEYITNNSLGSGAVNILGEGSLEFTDVYKSQWFYPYITKAVETEIATGYPDGTFRPTNTVNLAETLKVVMEADGIVLPEVEDYPFYDISPNAWYAPYFQEAKNREMLFYGTSLNVYPDKLMDRDHFAEMIYRYMKTKDGVVFGKGSYYADFFAGRGTSSGVPYDPNLYTAAHKELPFGTWLKVTNLENGKSVIVEVNDRGPFITGRVIDLSKVSFEDIGHLGSGVIRIQYEIIDQPL